MDAKVSNTRTHVRIWVNPQWPDKVTIGLE
jgi:hypothetical protein